MISSVEKSIKNINYSQYQALLFFAFLPTIYTTVRVFFLGQLPNEYSFSIAGQLAWVDLLYEIMNEAILLPLYYFLGQVKHDNDKFVNRIKTGLIMCLFCTLCLSGFVFFCIDPLLEFMKVPREIFLSVSTYIRIECIAKILIHLVQFMVIVLIMINNSCYIYVFTGVRLLLSLMFDTLLVSDLPISANLGVNGIGYSNILVNTILLIVACALLKKKSIYILAKHKLDFSWMKDLVKVGSVSGIESFVRNIAYLLMISRMVNIVGEQGTYWLANSFIWSWLLLPVLQLGELIKQEIASDREKLKNNTVGYFYITAVIVLCWIMSIPIWKPFMRYVLGVSEVDKLFQLVIILLVFYVFYAFQNIFDATFYALGKIKYMLFETIVTNGIYYGTAFVMYTFHIWEPSLLGIALLFGFGNLFDSIVSFGAYLYLLKKEHINLFEIS